MERPMSRWISTVRPSGRPFETSRCLRSPVDAGSIPYSAVTQPRPLPASQRGTPSWAEAVQMTRVPPCAISAEPVALRMKPGSIATGRISSGWRPSRLTRHAPRAPPPARAPLLDGHAVDALDRQLERAGGERPELALVARAEEAVGAAPPG